MAQDLLVPVGICEGHIAEFDVSAYRLPVFFFGRIVVAVFFCNFGRIRYAGRLVQKPGNALYVRLHGDQLGKVSCELLYRLKDTNGIRYECRKRAY